MGLFDKPEVNAEGNIRDLVGLPIHIAGIEMRDVRTMYGPGTALDITIILPSGETAMYSGFAAGIKRQAQDSDPSEYPVWARIEEKPLGEGKSTLVLVPSSEEEAAQLSVGETPSEDIPF